MSEIKIKILINDEIKEMTFNENDLTNYEKGHLEALTEREGLYGEL